MKKVSFYSKDLLALMYELEHYDYMTHLIMILGKLYCKTCKKYVDPV